MVGWLVVGAVVGCFLREMAEGNGYRSVGDHLPNMHEALGSTPGTGKKKKKKAIQGGRDGTKTTNTILGGTTNTKLITKVAL